MSETEGVYDMEAGPYDEASGAPTGGFVDSRKPAPIIDINHRLAVRQNKLIEKRAQRQEPLPVVKPEQNTSDRSVQETIIDYWHNLSGQKKAALGIIGISAIAAAGSNIYSARQVSQHRKDHPSGEVPSGFLKDKNGQIKPIQEDIKDNPEHYEPSFVSTPPGMPSLDLGRVK